MIIWHHNGLDRSRIELEAFIEIIGRTRTSTKASSSLMPSGRRPSVGLENGRSGYIPGVIIERGKLAGHGEAKFPAELASIGQARSFVQNECRDVQPDERTATAVLLTSELVTNAVEHAGSPVSVEVSTSQSVVRVAVGDDSDEPPVMTQANDWDERGRGLRWVDEMSHEWGVVSRDPGKTVWFTVDRDQTTP